MLLLISCGALLVFPMLALSQTGSASGDAKSAAAQQFRAYLEADWNRWMSEYPEMASGAGFLGHGRDWTDDSAAGIAARQKHLHESSAALKAIARDALPASEQLNYDLYRELLDTTEEGLQYGDDANPFRGVTPRNVWMPMNQMDGIQQGAASTLSTQPRKTVADYEDILARFEKLRAQSRTGTGLAAGRAEERWLYASEDCDSGFAEAGGGPDSQRPGAERVARTVRECSRDDSAGGAHQAARARGSVVHEFGGSSVPETT
jgi:hypothetical protein